jgi:hypothetical protein
VAPFNNVAEGGGVRGGSPCEGGRGTEGGGPGAAVGGRHRPVADGRKRAA